jgi:glycosyltransferase involved in cell wall biosynthesis
MMMQPTPFHVMHVISGLGLGGAEGVLTRLVLSSMDRVQHTVVSMTDLGVHGVALREAGVGVYTLNMGGGKLNPLALWRLRGLMRNLRPDIVQTWMYNADLFGGVAAKLAGIRRVSWCIRNAGQDLKTASGFAKFAKSVCARLSRFLPAKILVCSHSAQALHTTFGYDDARMQVINNGYDLERWYPDWQARKRLRQVWQVDETTWLLGCVARWNPLKDHANLCAAMASFAKIHPELDWRMVLVGTGIEQKNIALMAMLSQYGLQERVMLLGEREDVPAIMNALDLHVLPSKSEGFPNVLGEAMACGTPCVSTQVGDASLILGDTGWVVSPADPNALAQGLSKACKAWSEMGLHTDARLRARQAIRMRVQTLFGLDTMVNAYIDAWRELLAPKLLFIVTNPAFLVSHRLPVALGAQMAGYQVHAATMPAPGVSELLANGIVHHPLPITRTGRNPIQELKSLWAIYRLIRRIRPDLVHVVTIKSVLYGGLASRLAGVPSMVAAISGLGYVFMRTPRFFDPLKWVVVWLYRLALRHPHSLVIVQNNNDGQVLQQIKAITPEQTILIRGSGVDLDLYCPAAEPATPIVAVMVGRLLRDKGVLEFVQAARISTERGDAVQWWLVGSPDPANPASITAAELESWRFQDNLHLLGERTDIAALYANAHIAVLPSYREGLPRALIEAAACALPVVTTDVPGCRDAIEPGKTGLLVPVGDAQALADAVRELAFNKDKRLAMGAAGRQFAERVFDVGDVVSAHIMVYEALLSSAR